MNWQRFTKMLQVVALIVGLGVPLWARIEVRIKGEIQKMIRSEWQFAMYCIYEMATDEQLERARQKYNDSRKDGD